MRLPRFRLRTLMIAVALIGIVAGTVIEWRRLSYRAGLFRRLATQHAEKEHGYRTRAAWIDAGERGYPGAWVHAGDLRRLAEYHAAIKHAFDRIARNPWLTTPVLPPEPKVRRVPPRS